MKAQNLLKEFAVLVRKSTIKRLEKVPEGFEHWKINSSSLSFAEITKHLIDIDKWTIQKIKNPSLNSIESQTALMETCSREDYLKLIDGLKKSLDEKLTFIESLDEAEFNKKIYDEGVSKEISIALFFLRRNLDHEIHHRGQIAVYLRIISNK